MRKLFIHPKAILLAMTLLVVVLGHRAIFVTLDNSPETFYAADADLRETYHQLVQTFGADEVSIIELRGASHQNEQDLLALARLTREVESIQGVSSALSLSQIFDRGEGDLPVRLDRVVLEDVTAEVESIDLYRELGLVQQDAMSVMVTTAVEGPTARGELTSALQLAAQRIAGDRYQPSVAGLTATHAAFDRLTQRSLLLFMPAVVLIAGLVGLILFRSFRAILALFLPSLGAVVLGVAGLELAGQSLNLVTAVLPPLVMAIGFASAIHLITHYASAVRSGLEPIEAAWLTIREKIQPTAFAYTTTAVAFGSLALSPVTSVKVLGISVAITLFVSLLLVTLGTPAFLLFFRPRIHSPVHRQRLLENLAIWSVRHRLAVLTGSVGILGFLMAGAPMIEQSINGVRMLAPGSPERVSYERLESAGLGLGNLELWIHEDLRGLEDLRAEQERLRRLTEELEAIPRVTGTFSAADLLEVGELRLERLEARSGSRAQALREVTAGGAFREVLATTWQRRDGLKVTIMSLTADRPEQAEETRQQILDIAREIYPETSLELSGHYAVLIGAPGALMETLVNSLLVTVAIVAVFFIVMLRSFRLVVGGMAANVLPVLVVIGVMGWTGVPVDVATVMTSSVILGLAVDDTFHYLFHRRRSGSIRCAAAIAGQGIVATTLVVSIGFATLVLSGFTPVQSFGLLVALGAVVALSIDAVVLPALVGSRHEIEQACLDTSEPIEG